MKKTPSTQLKCLQTNKRPSKTVQRTFLQRSHSQKQARPMRTHNNGPSLRRSKCWGVRSRNSRSGSPIIPWSHLDWKKCFHSSLQHSFLRTNRQRRSRAVIVALRWNQYTSTALRNSLSSQLPKTMIALQRINSSTQSAWSSTCKKVKHLMIRLNSS